MTPMHSTQQDEAPESHDTVVQPPARIASGLIIVSIVLFVGIGVFVGAVALYGHMQKDVSAQGVLVGTIPVGGMTKDEVRTFVSDITDKLLSSAMTIHIETPNGTTTAYIDPVFVLGADGAVQELVLFDESAIVDSIFNYAKEGNRFMLGWNLLKTRFFNPSISVNGVHVVSSTLTTVLEDRTHEYRVPAVNASIQITDMDPLTVDITESTDGIMYDIPLTIHDLDRAFAKLSIPEVGLSSFTEHPVLYSDDLEAVVGTVETVLSQFPIEIIYTNTSTLQERKWTIYPERAATFLEPKGSADELYLGVQAEQFLTYVSEVIEPDVAVEPVNARFTMSNNKVQEFQAASPGIAVATSTLLAYIDTAIRERNIVNAQVTSTIVLDVIMVDPEISTESVNDLGITEILGVGTSNMLGSSANRVANIRNAINKLNGLIIAPGSEFSTIEHTKPYTLSGGYVPELVIKGDSITPEIGGGLCQIGTTLFRMAMNSGLKITERRNHSLVVSYYNDLENGLPGTDATLYDPAPDFKFVNDTEHYILIDVDLNESTGMLTFTLWGTSDGRTAGYSQPQVLEWYSPGETRYIESKDLAPGVTQCQNAYRGAYTSFVYTRTLPESPEPEEIEYTSRYRALPRICLVGAAEEVPCPDGDATCEPLSVEEDGEAAPVSSPTVSEEESLETVPTT